MNPTNTSSLKRKADEIIIDPDIKQVIESSKRVKIELDPVKKFKCLSAIVLMYELILESIEKPLRPAKATHSMDIDDDSTTSVLSGIKKNINVGNHIISIIFTIHNINRQKVKNIVGNMGRKTEETAFKINFRGKEYSLNTDYIKASWIDVLASLGLEYKDFALTDENNWYGTMGPYLDMFAAFPLRVNELRLGHNNMPVSKEGGVHRSFPVSKYGLSGAHHILLEGTSFPPERRSSIVQSLGPMTSWLCMLRSDGIYRKKYAAAVKRAMSHVPCIDELIEMTKTVKQASEVSMITTLVAEILLMTTSRQASRMYFPITIFADVWNRQNSKEDFSNFFNTTGAGGWYLYKKACELGPYNLSGKMESEKAAQITYHGIFGTFKEDLSVLEAITDIGNWFTREELGSCFRQQGTSPDVTKFTLPKVSYYSKMSCANQTGLLSGVYKQVTILPCFSGKREQHFDSAFFEHIEKHRSIATSGKTITQIQNILTSTLEDLHEKLRKDGGKMLMGTTKWREMSSLELGTPGKEIDIVIKAKSKMFLGKKSDY